MQIQVFSIPMEGDPEATEQLNTFLRSQKVLSIEKAAVAAGGRQYWSVCVEYLPRRGAEGPAARSGSKDSAEKSRIDYRELLTAPQFARFSKLRVLRKEVADSEGVPVYTLFTNAQLAELATNVPRTKDALASIEGIGEAKVKKYGDLLLELMSRTPLAEDEVRAGAATAQVAGNDAAPRAQPVETEVETLGPSGSATDVPSQNPTPVGDPGAAPGRRPRAAHPDTHAPASDRTSADALRDSAAMRTAEALFRE